MDFYSAYFLLDSNMNYNKAKDFVSGLSKLVDLGYDPIGPYVHACHETFFFDKPIGDFNFWGMKVPRIWTGKILEVNTHEQIKDKLVKSKERFVDFDNINHAFEHYNKTLIRLYKDAYDIRFFANAFLEKLTDDDEPGEFKWATHKDYIKILKIRFCQVINDDIQFAMLKDLITKHQKNMLGSNNT